MMKTGNTFSLPILVLGSALSISAYAQTSTPPTQAEPDQTAATSSSNKSNDNATYATGKPLQNESKEGFWGHMNPFARKKWVNRQTQPIKDRLVPLPGVWLPIRRQPVAPPGVGKLAQQRH